VAAAVGQQQLQLEPSKSRKQHQSCTRRLRRGLKAADAAPATPSPAQDELLLPLQRLPGKNAASYTLKKKILSQKPI